MDFKKSRRNRKLDSWITIVLLSSLALSLNFIISKVNSNIDLTPDKKFILSRETLALLNKMEDSIDIVITIKNNNDLPKIVQKMLSDLDILLLKFKQESTKHPINIYRLNLDSPKKITGSLLGYNISNENAITLYSPRGTQKTIFRFEDKQSANPYDLTQTFKSRDSHARQAIWQSELYEDWTETGRGVLEPTFFRGEQVLVEAILEVAGPKEEKKVVYFTRGHGEASPTDFDSES